MTAWRATKARRVLAALLRIGWVIKRAAWFDVAVAMSIFAIGSVLFGRFEQHNLSGAGS